jgi:mannitol-1-phosphate 5-dehydrogenase
MSDASIVIWGAGRIGRGFVADLFHAAGYQLVLVDQSTELVDRLRRAGRFTVVRAENAARRVDQVITNYTALATAQLEEVAAAVAAADSLALAVFPQVFPGVAQQLTPGLRRRQAERPEAALDIILCTNLAHAAAQFEQALRAALPPELHEYAIRRIGLVESLVMRMVADPPAELQQAEPLLVWTNGFGEFPVDRHAFKGDPPTLPGLRLVEDMRAEEMRKLYTYNMCHAVLAYQGARRGHIRTVDCLADPQVRAEAEGALAEVSRALQLEYGFAAGDMARWNERVLRQTDNPTLADTVARHGADPRRKLKRADRLVGPALLARKHGLYPLHLVRTIAAALLFHNPADPGAVYVQERIAAAGLTAAVRELCELTAAEEDLVAAIVGATGRLVQNEASGLARPAGNVPRS